MTGTGTEGSNRESCAMDESLTQRRRVEDECLRVVNSYQKAPANYVRSEKRPGCVVLVVTLDKKIWLYAGNYR